MLKLGVMGMSEGNQHPYSWAAIINGDYDQKTMDRCGSPDPPVYLKANRDTLGIHGARVTHVWTQDRTISEHIARASMIDTVVDRIEDFIGAVDAVLLLRDDPENHVRMVRPLIDAGVPLFIDKPLAYSWEDLDYFSEAVASGKHIFSCSSTRYSAGVQTSRARIPTLGRIRLAIATGKKDLRKYAIHYLEGMFSVLGDPTVTAVQHVSRRAGEDVLYLEFESGIVATVHVFMDIPPAGTLLVYGEEGSIEVNHGGAYPGFRNTATEAIRGFLEGKPRLEFQKTRNVIGALIAAKESLIHEGTRITLPRA